MILFRRRHQRRRELVLSVMAERNAWYGLDLVRVTGLSSGALVSILDELQDEGLVASFWDEYEVWDTGEVDVKRRRLYARTQ